jgi:uncharacterized protein (DUF2235 family)
MPKWLVLCLDGTWNTIPSDANQQSAATNVLRFHDSLARQSPNGLEQLLRYDSGVGTNWWEQLRGGGIGKGIDRIIKNAYRWLASNYAVHDHIAIVGFSRGAYAARSLVGLIRNCWLLDRTAVAQVARMDRRKLEHSRKYDDAMLDLSRRAYEIYRTGPESDGSAAQDFRTKYGLLAKIRFLGLWDTVGALGIPNWVFKQFLSSQKYAFHDTKLSGMVERAYHAIAIDEHRHDYAATLWDTKPEHHSDQIMDQCWFAGAHADVGGGYADRSLADITLRWMKEKGQIAGLGFVEDVATADEDRHHGPIHDSYDEFLGSLYSRLQERYFRPMGKTCGERLHRSVVLRHAADSGYRPSNDGFTTLLLDTETIPEKDAMSPPENAYA